MECSFKRPDTGAYVTRVQTVEKATTTDLAAFLASISGIVTSVMIAKDVCSNVGECVVCEA